MLGAKSLIPYFTAIRIFFLAVDVSGNCVSPLESLVLFNFIVAVIDLRYNSYKYSLNAKAGRQWGKSVFLCDLNRIPYLFTQQ